jgi:hypothetical protein
MWGGQEQFLEFHRNALLQQTLNGAERTTILLRGYVG